MRRKELQELVNELQSISDALYSATGDEDSTTDLMRLCTLMARLKSYPPYSAMADNVLNAIDTYTKKKDRPALVAVVAETEDVISFFNEKLENSVTNMLKKGYEEAKDRIDAVIPEEVKDACEETVAQVPTAGRKMEKTAKSRIRNWLLSDDDE